MRAFGTGVWIIIGGLLLIGGILLVSGLLDWILDVLGVILIIIGGVVIIFGLMSSLSGRGGSRY